METPPYHLLRRGKGGDPVYVAENAPLQRESTSAFPGAADTDILLAGGFTDLHPEASCPLSPTLQLNGDCTDLDQETLTSLARAELTRALGARASIWQVEPDPRVAALARSRDSLDDCLDQYGGVLQITPLLLGADGPPYPRVDSLEISKTKQGFRLHLQIHQPVDRQRCTLCGQCGAICPEHCIAPGVVLDMRLCSRCNRCVSACPAQALDLDGVEERLLTLPAILLLDDLDIGLPTGQTGIYRPDTLPQLFAQIYRAEVEETLALRAPRCQYNAPLQTGCHRCLDACPQEALTPGSEGIDIDHRQCVACGACLASCPTGALQEQRFSDRHFVEYFRTFSLPAHTRIILGSAQDLLWFWWYEKKKPWPQTLFLEYPQPAGLHAMHLLFLLAQGASSLLILAERQAPLARQIRLANSLFLALFDRPEPIRQVPVTALARELRQPAVPAAVTKPYLDCAFAGRREKLVHVMAYLWGQSQVPTLTLPQEPASEFGTLQCDQATCTLCASCVGNCHTGALTANPENFTLEFHPALCVQCGGCAALCPEQSLQLAPAAILDQTFFEVNILARANMVRCRSCGKPFGTRQTLERVMAILGPREQDSDLLHYCETCRVIQLYEGNQP